MKRIFSRRKKRQTAMQVAVRSISSGKDGLSQGEQSFDEFNFEAPNFNVVREGLRDMHVSAEKQSASQNNDTVSTPHSDQPQGRSKATDGDSLSISSDDELEVSKASTMSFGTHHPDDSFVAISATGLSSDEDSINSRYLDNPPHDGRLKHETKTSSLPRLTINTRQTMALLASDPPHTSTNAPQSREKKIMDESMTTPKTLPETPMFRDSPSPAGNDEFPQEADMNSTPQIHLPNNLQTSVDSSNSSKPLDTSTTIKKRKKISSRIRRGVSAEKEYWELQLKEIIFQHGADSIQAAKGMGNLGASLLRCKRYPEALTIYKKAVAVLRKHYGMNSLIVARGLDKIGLSASLCATPTNLDWAYIALKEALSIRISYLGPHHCDCADTLNNIAGVFLQKEEYQTALSIYLDVLTVRAAIFGKNHPSIAITASTLGKIYQHLSDFDNALLHYNLALTIYSGDPMNLNSNHPLVTKVFKQIAAIERLMVLIDDR